MDLIKLIESEQMKQNIPDFNVGDTVRVFVKVEGFVLKKQGGGLTENFTVRRVAYGVGVERTFPIHSPRIDRIEVVRRGKVRRAKLNYMRQRVGKAAKIKEVL